MDHRHRARCCRADAAPRGGGVGALLVGVVLVGVLAPGEVGANVFELYGAGSRGSAMGGAMSTVADDFTAVHYNMAAMALAAESFGVGFTMGYDDVAIRLKRRPSGYDLPDLGANSARIPSGYRLRARGDTEDLANTYGVTIGAVASLGLPFLRLGVLAYIPATGISKQRTRYPDEREQYFSNRPGFELLGERTEHLIIMVGLAYTLTDWLSIGAGLSFMPSSAGTNHIYLDNPTDQRHIDLTLDNEQDGDVAPQVGLLAQLGERWRAALVYRGELYFSFTSVNEIQIRGFQGDEEAFPVEQRLRAAVNYSPHRFVLGGSYQSEGLTVALDAQYAVWSGYVNHQGEADGHGFSDTLALGGGVEWRYSPGLNLRAGGGYEMSPVPEQTGRTNYVDNARLRASVGVGHPFELFTLPLELSWHVQYHYLVPRDTNKALAPDAPDCTPSAQVVCDELPDSAPDPVTGERVAAYQGLQTGNPGFPGFQSFGHLIAASVDLRWFF